MNYIIYILNNIKYKKFFKYKKFLNIKKIYVSSIHFKTIYYYCCYLGQF